MSEPDVPPHAVAVAGSAPTAIPLSAEGTSSANSIPHVLEPLRTPEFKQALDQLEDLLTQNSKALLLGAGCSRCAGLPLTAELTKKALISKCLSPESKEILLAIQSRFDGAQAPEPHIEDFLSELVDLLAITERRALRGSTDQTIAIGTNAYSSAQLSKAVAEIKSAIAAVIDVQVNVDSHRAFIRAIHRPLRPGKDSAGPPVDYLVMNYDTLLEDALSLEKISFADGLEGGATGWWERTKFQTKGLAARVLKLHGSINWLELPDDPLPRRIPVKVKDSSVCDRRILIWPASTKYRETQRDPYAQLASLARSTLRPPDQSQKILIVCGYSFGDSHINLELETALRESNGRLTALVFYSEPEPTGALKGMVDEATISEQILVFAKRGFYHGDKVIRSRTDLPWWQFEIIARLLGGER